MYKTTINYYKIIFITSKKIIKINFLYLWKIFKKLHIGSKSSNHLYPKKKKNSSNHDPNQSNENPNVTSTTASMSSSCARSMVGFCVEFQSRQTVRFLSSNWCKGLKNRPKIWRLWSIFSKLCNSKAFCIRRMLKTKWATRTSFMIRTVSLQPSWWSQQGLRRAALVTVEMNCRLRASDRGLVLVEI